jgi:predicted MFS family arabinose efflux permease
MASPMAILGILLVDIGNAFNRPVAVVGQIQTLSSTVAVVFALFMGILSVKYNHRKLLLAGLIAYNIAALGSGLSPNYTILLLLFSLIGIGTAMVGPMTATIVTDLYSPEKRGSILGYLMASLSISYIIGAVVIGYAAELFGWRMAFLGYAFPLFLVSLILSLYALPSRIGKESQEERSREYLDGFKAIRENKSAMAALGVVVLANASWQSVGLYSTAFIRTQYDLSTGSASIMMLIAALLFTLGAVASGRMLNRYGRKKIAVITAILAGVTAMFFTLMPNLWLCQILVWLSALFVGMRVTAFTTLELEQVPEFGGTMMSVDSAFSSLGSALGSIVGGAALQFSGYGLMSLSLGALHVLAAMVIYRFVKDTTYQTE